MRRRRRYAESLRAAIDCMPPATKRAMLEGIGANPIIVGAYTDNRGGVCPMLAAHRNGGRTAYAAFAHAWDRYTGARSRARAATERELRTLEVMLRTSLAEDEGLGDGALSEAIAEHRTAKRRREAREVALRPESVPEPPELQIPAAAAAREAPAPVRVPDPPLGAIRARRLAARTGSRGRCSSERSAAGGEPPRRRPRVGSSLP